MHALSNASRNTANVSPFVLGEELDNIPDSISVHILYNIAPSVVLGVVSLLAPYIHCKPIAGSKRMAFHRGQSNLWLPPKLSCCLAGFGSTSQLRVAMSLSSSLDPGLLDGGPWPVLSRASARRCSAIAASHAPAPNVTTEGCETGQGRPPQNNLYSCFPCSSARPKVHWGGTRKLRHAMA